MEKVKQNLPLLSICCITYNHEKFVKRAIESIWDQDYENIEIIVIEDGSTDKTLEKLKSLALISKFPMKVITQNNTGNIGYNLNKTIKDAKGEYIIFTSLDDYYFKNKISFLMNKIINDINIDFISAIPTQDMVCFPDLSSYNYNQLKINDLLNFERCGGGFWLHETIWKKSIIDDINGFDEDLIGDDIVLRTKALIYLMNRGYSKFFFVEDRVFYHRVHEGSISHKRERQCQILFEVINRYFEKKYSKTYISWYTGAIEDYIKRKNLRDAFRLIFFDKKNVNKPYFIIRFLPEIYNNLIKQYVKKFKNDLKFRLKLLYYKNKKRREKHRIINFEIKGGSGGSLISLEENKNIPFDIKRVYYIFDTKKDVRRGFHAHKNLKQVLVAVKGGCKILLDDGKNKEDVLLDSPNKGLLIKKNGLA